MKKYVENLSFKAVSIGLLIDVFASIAIQIGIVVMWIMTLLSFSGDMKMVTKEYIEAFMKTDQYGYIVVVAALIGNLLGGYFAVKIEKSISNAIFLGIINASYAMVFIIMRNTEVVPIWVTITSMIFALPMAYLGGTMALRKKENDAFAIRLQDIDIEFEREYILSATIRYFYNMGFFRKMTLDKAIGFVNDALKMKNGSAVIDEENIDDLSIITLDKERMFKLENIKDVEKPYTYFLKELGKISRGIFNPGYIREEWSTGEDGAIESAKVLFLLNDGEYSITHTSKEKEVDFTVAIATINEAVRKSGYFFEGLKAHDGNIYFVILGMEERVKLIEDRGWILK